jgi:hypothetical protein
MADAEQLQIDLIKRGAANHVRDLDLLINAANRARRAAGYTAGTGKQHPDDSKAHAAQASLEEGLGR